MTDPSSLRAKILKLTREYSKQVHAGFRPATDPYRLEWQEGAGIPYAGRVFTEDEVEAAVASTLDFGSRWARKVMPFQRTGIIYRVRHSLLVNSALAQT